MDCTAQSAWLLRCSLMWFYALRLTYVHSAYTQNTFYRVCISSWCLTSLRSCKPNPQSLIRFCSERIKDYDAICSIAAAVAHFYRATAKHTHGIAVEILSVRQSVRPSVKRVYCDKTKAPSEKSSIMTNRKSPTSFPMSLRWISYVAPNPPKGPQKHKFDQ